MPMPMLHTPRPLLPTVHQRRLSFNEFRVGPKHCKLNTVQYKSSHSFFSIQGLYSASRKSRVARP